MDELTEQVYLAWQEATECADAYLDADVGSQKRKYWRSRLVAAAGRLVELGYDPTDNDPNE